MAPPYTLFPVSELEARIQTINKNGKEKRRKDPIDLKRCRLQEMVQYNCDWDEGVKRIVCSQLVRLFRRCNDGVMIETTAWEEERKTD